MQKWAKLAQNKQKWEKSGKKPKTGKIVLTGQQAKDAAVVAYHLLYSQLKLLNIIE